VTRRDVACFREELGIFGGNSSAAGAAHSGFLIPEYSDVVVDRTSLEIENLSPLSRRGRQVSGMRYPAARLELDSPLNYSKLLDSRGLSAVSTVSRRSIFLQGKSISPVSFSKDAASS
jgi:hypothetical protein